MTEKGDGQGEQKKVIPIAEGYFHLPSTPGERGYLIAGKCNYCGEVVFPTPAVCPACIRDGTVQSVVLSGNATLLSFTVVRRGPPGFPVPYIMALVRLEEGPIIYSLISGCEPRDDALTRGQELGMVIERIREDQDGNEIVGWKFRPSSTQKLSPDSP